MDMNKKPSWLKVRYRAGGSAGEVESLLTDLQLHTVCQEAACPNQGECFNRKTATFMILGRVCTRNCTFCNVTRGIPGEPDGDEPERVAQAVKALGLRHVVITSVTRDDLADGGAEQFARVIRAVKEEAPGVVVEVLIPDFKGDEAALETVIRAFPEVINHNVETVPRLYPEVRPQAVYERSLELLERVKRRSPGIHTKSGLMLGLGETREEVLEVLKDLRGRNCDFLTMGHYLAPSGDHHPVVEWVSPEEFDFYREEALSLGFLHAACAPLVRSSYLADEALKALESRTGGNRRI